MLDRQPDSAAFYRFRQRGGGQDRNLWSVEKTWEKILQASYHPSRGGR
jgi:hypothetical protein